MSDFDFFSAAEISAVKPLAAGLAESMEQYNLYQNREHAAAIIIGLPPVLAEFDDDELGDSLRDSAEVMAAQFQFEGILDPAEMQASIMKERELFFKSVVHIVNGFGEDVVDDDSMWEDDGYMESMSFEHLGLPDCKDSQFGRLGFGQVAGSFLTYAALVQYRDGQAELDELRQATDMDPDEMKQRWTFAVAKLKQAEMQFGWCFNGYIKMLNNCGPYIR